MGVARASLEELLQDYEVCLIHQTNYLLDQQLRQLEKAFLEKGGFTERLYQAINRAAKKGIGPM